MPSSSLPFAESNDITYYNVNVPGASESYNSFLVASDIVAPPGVLQISSFGFDDAQNDDVDMTNDVTDHWVEDNVQVQDHIGVEADKTAHPIVAQVADVHGIEAVSLFQDFDIAPQ